MWFVRRRFDDLAELGTVIPAMREWRFRALGGREGPMADSMSEITEATPQGVSHAEPRPGAVLAIVSAGVILSGIDLFIVNVALPQIGAGLRVHDLADLSWLLNAYTVVFAALLIPLGRLADRSSRKLGFLLGIGIFTVASAACAAAGGLGLLIEIGRAHV